MYKQALAIDKRLDYLPEADAYKGKIIRALAKRTGLVVLRQSQVQMDIHEAIALRDHMNSSTSAFCKLAQGLTTFVPDLKLLPSNIRRGFSEAEREGSIPPEIVTITDCAVNKTGNKQGNCTFYYSSRPTALLALMLRSVFVDGAFEEISTFSSLKDQIVVCFGFDKSDNDFIGTWRVCNRKKGNSSIYVQEFACLEGPVAENYENKKKSIGRNDFPVRAVIQSLVDDELFALTLTAEKKEITSCFVFKPVPVVSYGKERSINAVLHPATVNESVVAWTDHTGIQEGQAPEIVVPLSVNTVGICLVTSKNNAL